jgi:hypothetical protein
MPTDITAHMPDHGHMSILLQSPVFPPAVAGFVPRITARPAAGSPATRAPLIGEIRTTATTLPVTTVKEAVRVALDRTRRMTLLGSVPVLRRLALPWLLPLHLLIVGLTADHIRHTAEASLSYSDGRAPRVHPGSLVLALLLATGWLAGLGGTVVALTSWQLTTPAGVVVAIAVMVPVVELLGLLDFAVRNPEWVMLKRARSCRADRRTAYVLTSLVSTRDGCGAARRLMDLTYPQWQAADVVVIGYPASKSLISYYVRMGARRGGGAEPRNRTVTGRATGRCVTFDCRRPLRVR